MTVGVEIRRDGDSLLLTNNLKNPIVRASGVATTLTNVLFAAGGGSYFTVTYTGGDMPLCVIKPPLSNRAFLYGFQPITGGFSWTWWVSSAVGTSIPWWIFNTAVDAYTNVGLEIYDDAGGLPVMFTTDISHNPLRVVDVVTGAGSTSYDASRDYGFAQGRYSGTLTWELTARDPSTGTVTPGFYALVGRARTAGFTAGGNFTQGLLRLDPPTSAMTGTDTPDFADERDWAQRSLMVVDVTDY